MSMDFASQLMAVTVEVEQALPDGRHMIGAAFLIDDPTPDGRPRTVLVTAGHVLEKMPGAVAHVGYRIQGADGGWRYDPQPLTIRAHGAPLWTRNPDHDIAAIAVVAPPEFARAAIPLAWLADAPAFGRAGVGPGQELLVLGYPQGLSANSAGFPILRAGRVASPVEADAQSPTFLLDFRVFPGNSGGPVFLADANGSVAVTRPLVVGMLTQQVELNNERLELGVVTEAPFVRDTLAQLDRPAAPIATAKAQPAAPASTDASAWVGNKVAD
jgi:S1-C subfamily serine protease